MAESEDNEGESESEAEGEPPQIRIEAAITDLSSEQKRTSGTTLNGGVPQTENSTRVRLCKEWTLMQ